MTALEIIRWMGTAAGRRFLGLAAIAVLILGTAFRLHHITLSDFVFYDEGYYLDFNYRIGQFIAAHPAQNFQDVCRSLYVFLCVSLATGKTLWFLLADSRWFFNGLDAWFVARVWAAVFGLLVFIPAYFFCKKFYGSQPLALLAVILLSVLPSHVFYSRIALQETLSAFVLLSGFYFYLFPRRFGWQTFAAGVIFGLAFFTNYRLIMLPLLVGVVEAWQSFAEKEKPQFRKFLWCLLTFFSFVFLVGNIGNGANTRVVFSWMLHQAQLAKGEFNFINLFSYPYYVFRLETFLFGVLFFGGNIYLLAHKHWSKLLPFVLVLVQMMVFSFAGEKGARYLYAVMPFMAMSAAYAALQIWNDRRAAMDRFFLLMFCGIMLLGMTIKSAAIIQSSSDYRVSAEDLLRKDPGVKFLSTQPYVQALYARQKDQVKSAPHTFEGVVQLSQQGYRYLLVDPQAYISWTTEERRFDLFLDGYMGFLVKAITPDRTYSNFSDVILERFVFEQSEHLPRSIEFLRQAKERNYGEIRVYDLDRIVPAVLRFLSSAEQERGARVRSR